MVGGSSGGDYMKELEVYNAAVKGVCDAFRVDCLDGSLNDLTGYFWAMHEDFVSWGYGSLDSEFPVIGVVASFIAVCMTWRKDV